ncbi:MAG: hypothetical protein AAGF07_00035 [Patescibacteria group bacterium]
MLTKKTISDPDELTSVKDEVRNSTVHDTFNEGFSKTLEDNKIKEKFQKMIRTDPSLGKILIPAASLGKKFISDAITALDFLNSSPFVEGETLYQMGNIYEKIDKKNILACVSVDFLFLKYVNGYSNTEGDRFIESIWKLITNKLKEPKYKSLAERILFHTDRYKPILSLKKSLSLGLGSQNERLFNDLVKELNAYAMHDFEIMNEDERIKITAPYGISNVESVDALSNKPEIEKNSFFKDQANDASDNVKYNLLQSEIFVETIIKILSNPEEYNENKMADSNDKLLFAISDYFLNSATRGDEHCSEMLEYLYKVQTNENSNHNNLPSESIAIGKLLFQYLDAKDLLNKDQINKYKESFDTI